jgi:antitoxin HigA-1
MGAKELSVGKIGRPPTHPGEVLREDVLPTLRFSVTEAARELGVSSQTLHGILAEKHPATPVMALRLGRFCGNGPDVWLRMQAAYDLWGRGNNSGRSWRRSLWRKRSCDPARPSRASESRWRCCSPTVIIAQEVARG